MTDVLVVGAGAAGAAAALALGRMRRTVTVVDSGSARNRNSHGIHGFPSRDGMSPAEFRAAVTEELARYDITVLSCAVTDIARVDDEFVATVAGDTTTARRVLLATGVRDVLPDIPGVAEAWGAGVYHCQHCHGWELRDRPMLVFGGLRAAQLAAQLIRLSPDVTLVTPDATEAEADLTGVHVIEGSVAGVRRSDTGVLVDLADGDVLAGAGLFVTPQQEQAAPFAELLGCTFLPNGRVQTNAFGHTGVAGVYAAGDMARTTSTRFHTASVLGAAAAGAQAGMSVDQELAHTDAAARV